MSLTLYGLPNCDTCRKARKWLDAAGIPFDFVDYRTQPVTATTLKRWAAKLGGWDKLVNRASRTWRELPGELKAVHTDAQWLKLVSGHPTLVRRPVIETDKGDVSVGFSVSRFDARFRSR